MNILKFLTLSFSVLTVFSCTQFEDIGSDLVDNDKLQITTDTEVDYELQTTRRDSILAYAREGSQSSDFVPTTHILGQAKEPVFGYSRYDLTAQVRFSNLGIDFSGATFDSAFLLLSYDTTFAPYGETDQMQTLDIFELQSRELPERVYVTDDFETKPGVIGSLTFTPSYKNQNRGDSLTAPSHIRIPMSMEFGQRIINLDTTITSSILKFLEEFPGFVVRPREENFSGFYRFFAYASSTSGSGSNSNISNYSGIRIYYTKEGESKQAYLQMSPVLHHFTTVVHQYEGSEVGKVLESQLATQEYLFIQPTGVGVQIDFNNLDEYRGKVINNATLTWSVGEHPVGDTSLYHPMSSVFAREYGSVSDRRPISDILLNQSGGAYQQFFGGVLLENDPDTGSKYVYKFNITNHFQHMIDGSANPSIIIVPTPQDVSRIARSVIYGPGIEDVKLQPKIEITYSSTTN